uniref:Uncharacterized protein LOC111105927 n=1 Tax=Crassostrea virginica TaxID=6565 RepID=A0A8B8B0K8_CRAVI|nr:uncharacterized protein LOC111105927 [Crassostrea virginica]
MLMYAGVYVIIAVLTVSAIETVYCNISGKYCLQNALKLATTYAEQCDYLDTEDDANRLEYECVLLNQTCEINAQCMGTPYATCLGGVCTCIEGYKPTTSSECVLKMSTDTENCPLTCEVKWENSEYDNLMMITLEFTNYQSSKTIQCCGHHFKRPMHLIINCQYWIREQVEIITSEQCDDKIKSDCISWGKICICHCHSEYMMVNGHCVKESVLLNQTCEINAQCMGTPYATCCGGVCTCIEGYKPTTSSECVLNLQGPSQAESRGGNTDVRRSDVGLIIGVLFGGICLGALITTGIAFVIFKRSQFTSGKREEPNVVFADNKAYSVISVEINGGEENPSCPNVQQKAISSSKHNNSKEIPEYSNHSGNAKKQDDVYNHLNEKDDSVDDDTYDHASAAIEHEGDANDYSSVDDIEKKTAVSDNYFTLEKN